MAEKEAEKGRSSSFKLFLSGVTREEDDVDDGEDLARDEVKHELF